MEALEQFTYDWASLNWDKENSIDGVNYKHC